MIAPQRRPAEKNATDGLPQVKIVPTIQLTKGGPPIMSAPEKNEEWDSDHKQKAMLAAYAEICKSYHAIDAFRMKLLGLLPLASLVGVFLIDRDKLSPVRPRRGHLRAS
jgi:hypothetical protein